VDTAHSRPAPSDENRTHVSVINVPSERERSTCQTCAIHLHMTCSESLPSGQRPAWNGQCASGRAAFAWDLDSARWVSGLACGFGRLRAKEASLGPLELTCLFAFLVSLSDASFAGRRLSVAGEVAAVRWPRRSAYDPRVAGKRAEAKRAQGQGENDADERGG